MFSNSREHLRTNFVSIVKSKDYIRPARTGKNLMGTGFAFDVPSEAKKCGEDALGFGWTTDSCGGKRNDHEFRRALGVFKSIRQRAERECLKL